MVAPLYHYTGQVAPRFGNSRSLVNCRNGAITSRLRLISTSDCFPHPNQMYTKCSSIWYDVSGAYGCTLIPLHRPSWPQIWEFCPLWTVKKVPLRHGWGWYPPQTASHILIRHIQSVWAIDMLSQGHMLHPYTVTPAKLAPDLGKQGHLWSENDAIMSWLWLMSTSACSIHPY